MRSIQQIISIFAANNKIKKLLPAEYEIRRKQAEIVFLQGFFYESY